MSRLTPDELHLRIAADALAEAFLASSAPYWRRRAQQLLDARPRAGENHGRATPAELSARYQALTEAAAACYARASGADGWAREALAQTAEDLARGEAA